MRKPFLEAASNALVTFETEQAIEYKGTGPVGPWGVVRIDLFQTLDGRWIAEESQLIARSSKNKWKSSYSYPCYEISVDDAVEWFQRHKHEMPKALLDALPPSTSRTGDAMSRGGPDRDQEPCEPRKETRLSKTKRDILEAVLQLKAFDSDSSVTADEIANRAGVGAGSGENIKKPLSQLVKDHHFLSSAGGETGGIG